MNHFCCNCGSKTTWEVRKRYEVCMKCKTKFPCPGKCSHYDCLEAKGKISVCDEHRIYGCKCEKENQNNP